MVSRLVKVCERDNDDRRARRCVVVKVFEKTRGKIIPVAFFALLLSVTVSGVEKVGWAGMFQVVIPLLMGIHLSESPKKSHFETLY